MSEEREMTILEHLDELRSRLIKSAIALLVTTLFSFFFATRFLKLLIAPAGNVRPVFLTPTEGFITYMRVALLSGLGLAMPVIVYQILRFIAPGLKVNERKYVYVALPVAAFSFIAGIAFAYFILLPAALNYLGNFGSEIAEARWAVGEYIAFVTSLLFWIGVVFETPLLAYILAKLGIVTPKLLSSNRKYAILIIAIVSAVITPTADPFNMLLLMAPLVVLYEISIWVTKLAR
jgi:sec-independent protein translocase protein TatC